MRNLRTKREDVVMISWFSVSRKGRVAHPARAVAGVIFLATTAPWAAYGANGGLMSLQKGVVTKNFGGIVLGEAEETGTSVTNPIFNDGGVNTRQVTNRNTPTMINGVYLNRIFWDGRGQNLFNGVNPNGALDPAAKILADDGAGLKPEPILSDHAALAPQAGGWRR